MPRVDTVPSPPVLKEIPAWLREATFVFVVGSPRSGTTWLQSLLASHPDIVSGPESHFFVSMRSLLNTFEQPQDRKLGLSAYLSSEQFYYMVGDWFVRTIAQLDWSEDSPRIFLEKTPHHSQYAEFILKAFPQAKFIHLVRDARAVVASSLRIASSWGKDWAPSTVDAATAMWLRNVKAGWRIPQLMNDPTNQYFEIKYEALREQPERRLAELWQWIGVDVKDEWVGRAVQQNDIAQARSSAAAFSAIAEGRLADAQPTSQTSIPPAFVGQGTYRAEDSGLSRLQLLRLEQLAGDILDRLGYARLCPNSYPWERLATSPRLRKALRLKEI
ncbi:MAG: sulfotransferase [Cyanobacteria bacterium J06642_2]